MRILQVSTWDLGGGAERVAWQLMEGCAAAGHDSWLAAGGKLSTDPRVLAVPPQRSRSPFAKLARRWRREMGHEEFDYPGSALIPSLCPQPPDVIHCHNLHGPGLPEHGYFDLRLLPHWSGRSAVVLTLHDAWLLSGHCAHSFDCERWKTGCGQCPDLAISVPIKRDGSAHNWRVKQNIFQHSRVCVATPSHWLMRKVEQSLLAPAIIEQRVIPNGIDLSIFGPGDRRQARAALGIPAHAQVLLFVSNGGRKNPWKDYSTLRQAFDLLRPAADSAPRLTIVLGEKSSDEHAGTMPLRFVPFQTDARQVAQYYHAADVYVHPTKADTFPTVIREALACGCPVVATAIGGVVEQITEGVTGYLTAPGDAAALAARLGQVLDNENLRRRLSAAAVAEARESFGLDKQVQTYLAWYQKMLAEKKSAGTLAPSAA